MTIYRRSSASRRHNFTPHQAYIRIIAEYLRIAAQTTKAASMQSAPASGNDVLNSGSFEERELFKSIRE
jgi:hypothetical protein